MNKLNGLDILALVLIIVGGLNWGLVGLFNYNLVEAIFGLGTITTAIYALVGLSAVYAIPMSMKLTKK